MRRCDPGPDQINSSSSPIHFHIKTPFNERLDIALLAGTAAAPMVIRVVCMRRLSGPRLAATGGIASSSCSNVVDDRSGHDEGKRQVGAIGDKTAFGAAEGRHSEAAKRAHQVEAPGA
jgi:hypothetical protein